jgi:polyhydroxyalkanoate synthesis regulator phasin
MQHRNQWRMGLLGLGAAAILSVSATGVYAQTTTPGQTPPAPLQAPSRGAERNALLAEALGISEEALQAAITTVRNAAIDQAVADGRITQEQADQLKAQTEGRGFGWGRLGAGADGDAALAQALGITVEELQAAKAAVQSRLLDEAVAAGEITQAEADLIQARQALQSYLQERMQTAYEQAIAQAVTDGVITQAQADQILSEPGPGFFGRGGELGGRHGGPAGRLFSGSRNDVPPSPDTGTPEESGSPVVPSSDLNL